MARLPQVGGDAGNWGSLLNDYLLQTHNADGKLKSDAVYNLLVNGTGITISHDSNTQTITLSATSSADGREVELGKSVTHIQWRYVGDISWVNLVALTDITGPQGAAGSQGPQGIAGTQGATGAQGPAGDPATVIPQAESEAGVATTVRAVSATSLKRDIEYRISQKFVVLEANDPAGTDPGVIYFRKAV